MNGEITEDYAAWGYLDGWGGQVTIESGRDRTAMVSTKGDRRRVVVTAEDAPAMARELCKRAGATVVVLEVPDGMDEWDAFSQEPYSVMLDSGGKPRVQVICTPGDYRIVPAQARSLAVALAHWADRAEALEPDPEQIKALAKLIRLGEGRNEIATAILAALPGLGYEKRGRFCPDCCRTEGDGHGARFDGPNGQPCIECREPRP